MVAPRYPLLGGQFSNARGSVIVVSNKSVLLVVAQSRILCGPVVEWCDTFGEMCAIQFLEVNMYYFTVPCQYLISEF